MVKIGVLSDTHLTDMSKGVSFLDHLRERFFKGVDMIFHAGDVVNPDVLMAFTGTTIHVVRGNMDPPVRGIPTRKVIEVEGFRIGLIHGWGAPDTLEEKILKEFQGQKLDAIVYGHSHAPVCRRKDGILFFNPGSPTDRRWAPYHSVGILEVGSTIQGRILCLEDDHEQ